MDFHNMMSENHRLIVELKREKNENNKLDKVLISKIDEEIKELNKSNKLIKEKMYSAFNNSLEVRNLRNDSLNNKKVISIFDSVLTRTLNIEKDALSTDIFVIKTYFYDILKDIIHNGFIYNNEKYVCFTASAGQIRTKKTVFIRESVLNKHQNSLMCGLTPDTINEKGGVNINKFLAYLALSNSATDEWEDFDIDKVVVVDDMETNVKSMVDFINEEDYNIRRQEMDVLINHTDGCGMMLPSVSKKSMMIRLPWIKGLVVPFPFDSFIKKANENNPNKPYGKVRDIYRDKEYDIIEDGIQIILTKSQFKMWKFYSSWKDYKDNFKKHDCQAGYCNKEEDETPNAKLNYQMMQTLVDITDEELESISENTKKQIDNIGKDRNTMLKVLGITKSNNKKNYLQQALEIYPELLQDKYSREIIKQVKKSLVKEARAAKLEIAGKYTFICPDLYAFCEWLFLREKNPIGLLGEGEVYCNLYKNIEKLDCLRSPHLYREHAVRKNVIDDKKKKWFITKGLYTSCRDAISKVLMFDVDGDKSLVISDKLFVEIAERNMRNIVPLYYNMAKADPEAVNNESIYNGLKAAYTGGNIGTISNNITKIWNSENVNLDVIKWLCLENNFVIDYAKTLYKPKRPKEKDKIIRKYTKSKTPHFFIYAKDKSKKNVEKINNSVVNRLENIIPNPRFKYSSTNVGHFDYKFLLSDPDAEIKECNEIIKKYTEQDQKSHFMIDWNDKKENNSRHVYNTIKQEILSVNPNPVCVTDVLVNYLYNHKNSSYKTTLWECFGDIIVENIKRNLTMKFEDGHIQCIKCGIRVKVKGKNHKMCRDCWKEREKKKKREWKRKYDKNKKMVEVFKTPKTLDI